MIVRPIAVAIVFALSLPVAAIAAQAPDDCKSRDPARVFAKMDANGDGVVTGDEMVEVRTARLQRADADGDGSITVEEFKSAAPPHLQRRADRLFARLDNDGNGGVSLEEVSNTPSPMMRFVDSDGDGMLTQAELAARPCRRGAPRR